MAYLDGELSAEECRRVEQRLANDADYRRRLTELEQAWSALEALPPTKVDDDFARTTIEMVDRAAEGDWAESATQAVGRRQTYWLAAGAGRCWRAFVLRGLFGRVGTARWWPTCR